MDPKVILETAKVREETSAIEALMLLQEGDAVLPQLTAAAEVLNQKAHGNRATFVRSKAIHYTNVCRAECSFCSFYRKKGSKGAFALTANEIARMIRESSNVRQVTLRGGLNPDLTLAYHLDVLRTIRSEFDELHIQGYSPSEIHFIARRARTTAMDVLRRMKDAGLDSLAGDSADILNDKVRKKLAPDKLRTHDWIDIIRTAHRLGLPTTATMLFGHVEDEIHVSEHLDILKSLQKETGGFTSFEPIPFVAARTEIARTRKLKPLTIEHVLRVVAVARIYFGRTIRNISIDWTKVGIQAAARALTAGANDLGPMSTDAYEIRSPEADGRLTLPAASLQAAIKSVGKVPVEREPYSTKSVTFKPRVEEPILV